MADWDSFFRLGQICSALPVILDVQLHHRDVQPLTACLWTPRRRSSERVTRGSVYEKRKTLSRCWRCLGTINVRRGLNYLSWAQLQSWELDTILHFSSWRQGKLSVKLRDCLCLPSTLFKMEFDENRILFHVIRFVFCYLILQQLYVIGIRLIFYLTYCL